MQQEQQVGRRVRVLGGSNQGPPTQPYPPPSKHAISSPSSSFTTSKPLKARVDPSAFATPVLRRTPSSQSTTPIPRPRAQVTPGLAVHAAPSTPLGSPFARAAPTVTSPRIVQGAPSPVRARPGLHAGNGVYKSGAQDSCNRSSTAPTTISHLPSSVSTRLHTSSPLPPLSVSSSSDSSTPSPLTSPNPHNSSYEFASPSLGARRTSATGLLPAHPIAVNTYRSTSPGPLTSPTIGQRRNTRPPATGSRGARSLSVTSSSSMSSVVSSQEEGGRAHVRAPSALGVQGKGKGRDEAVPDAGEAERTRPATVSTTSEEREQDARVARKILDLEITTNSLLTINASLERLKVLHTTEIRDLRRRLRESRSLAPLSSAALVADEGAESDSTCSEEDEEASWEEMMAEDQRFASVAGCLEALVRRGKEAIAFRPVVLEGGRVLHQVEMEGSWEEEEEGGGLYASEDWGALPD